MTRKGIGAARLVEKAGSRFGRRSYRVSSSARLAAMPSAASAYFGITPRTSRIFVVSTMRDSLRKGLLGLREADCRGREQAGLPRNLVREPGARAMVAIADVINAVTHIG
jgi:hypothetical protein